MALDETSRSPARAGQPAETGQARPAAGPQRSLRTMIVMPAYNAAQTLQMTYGAIPLDVADRILLVDDASRDETVDVARALGLAIIRHPHNVGYGGNQKTCYTEALRLGADVVVMLHPDGQYDASLIPEITRPIVENRADLVLGSRMATPGGARAGGMPLYKRCANRALTAIENTVLGTSLSEMHTGYRAYGRRFLETVPFLRNSNDFAFDTEVIFQAVAFRMRIAEVPVATRYFPGASSANLRQSTVYGLKTVWTACRYLLHRTGLLRSRLFLP